MPAAPDPRLGRWIFASVSDHFNTRRGTLPMYIEGEPRPTAVKDFFELRMDGPDYTELSHNLFNVFIEVNCLVQSTCDDKNYHRIHHYCAIVAYMFDNIQIYRYGNGSDPNAPLYDPANDQSFIGCLTLEQSSGKTGEKLVTRHFGIIEPKTMLMQSCVEGHYSMSYSI